MIYSNNYDPLLKEVANEYAQKNVKVMFAFKMRGTEITNEQCLSFIVENKLPLSELAPEDVLPSEIVINGKYYITDVIEIKNAKVLACPSQCITWQNPATPPGNRNTVRPLVGGLSIGSKNYISPTECYLGTLGFIAVDKASQALVGVTNAHVVVRNPFITINQNLNGIAQNEKDDYVYQTGETCTVNPAIQIGQVIRYTPLVLNPPPLSGFSSFIRTNTVDAALVSLKQSDISNTESFKQYGLNYNLPLPFATSNELIDLYNTQPNTLYSSGRTTGAKGDGLCGLYTFGLYGDSIDVGGYHVQGQDVSIKFSNIIVFRALISGCIPTAAGDSGSALIADIGGVRKIIGIVFGEATINGTIVGLACRIDWVVAKLGIEAWDGSPKKFIDTASIAYTTVPGMSPDSAIKKDGKIYWQVGLINSNDTTTTTTTTI